MDTRPVVTLCWALSPLGKHCDRCTSHPGPHSWECIAWRKEPETPATTVPHQS